MKRLQIFLQHLIPGLKKTKPGETSGNTGTQPCAGVGTPLQQAAEQLPSIGSAVPTPVFHPAHPSHLQGTVIVPTLWGAAGNSQDCSRQARAGAFAEVLGGSGAGMVCGRGTLWLTEEQAQSRGQSGGWDLLMMAGAG